MTRKDDFLAILRKLEELHKEHPTYSYGNIVGIAFAEYSDVWAVTNKEALFALEKYEAELEFDNDKIASPAYIERLYEDVNNFDHILDEDEDD